jgi:hypothetical protein
MARLLSAVGLVRGVRRPMIWLSVSETRHQGMLVSRTDVQSRMECFKAFEKQANQVAGGGFGDSGQARRARRTREGCEWAPRAPC